ncbi:MAG TPA: hypothetical protein VG815_07580, partial [Chloroflexota bacterium]|nr:hypothetical protein [Chloroflexota bacterium]
KGYGTPEHHEALISLGPCSIHRLTFSPAFANCTIAELAALSAITPPPDVPAPAVTGPLAIEPDVIRPRPVPSGLVAV